MTDSITMVNLTLEENIRVERILKYKDKLNITELCKNKNLTINMIQYFLDQDVFPEEMSGYNLSSNPNLTVTFLRENSYMDWDWSTISVIAMNHMNIDSILRYKYMPWRFGRLGYANPSQLTLEHVVQNGDIDWNWYAVTFSMTMKEFEENPDLPWDFYNLSYNKNLDLDYVLANIDKRWDWFGIYSTHDAKRLMCCTDTPDHRYKYFALSGNKYLTRNDVNAHPHENWNGIRLLENKIKTLDEIVNHFDNECVISDDYIKISMIPHLRIDEILKHGNIYWSWLHLSEYLETISIEDVEARPELPWSWHHLSRNPKILEVSDKEYEEAAKAIIAANKIKRQFRRAMTDPTYTMCVKRLRKEFDEMM
jgi:hypothetical protein